MKSRRQSQFNVTITVDGHKLEVIGSDSPVLEAVTNPDSPHFGPAEGGLDEITEVYLLDDDGERIELPTFLQEKLDGYGADGKIDDEVCEALSEQREE
jgi:hypothetical protein